MKKSIISRGLYVESLRRLRVFGFIALAAMLIIQLAPNIFQLFEYFYHYANESYITGGDFDYNPYPSAINFSNILLAVPITVTVVTPIMVLIAFSVFNKRASSDFYHALPYTRPCIFVSTLAAVFTWVIGICLICTTAGLVSYLAFPKVFTVIYDGAFDLLLSYLALMLLTAGATALGMSATGTILSNICVTLLIVFLPRFIMTVMTLWIESSAEFLAFNQVGNSFLSTDINILFGIVAGIFYVGEVPDFANNVPADIYSVCLGIVYIILALVVFVLRKSETATQPAPGRAAQHMIRILLTMVVGIFSTILFLEGEFAGCVIVTLIAITVYFAYELITTHRWKNCLKALPFLGVVFGLCIVCGIVMVAVPYISATYTPEPDEIDSVRFVNEEERYGTEWFGSEAQDLELKDREIIEKVSKTLKKNMDVYREKGHVGAYSYEIITDSVYHEESQQGIEQTVAIKKGGITKYRTLFFSTDDYSDVLIALENNEEYIKACKTLPEAASGSIDFGIYNRAVDYSYYEKVLECMQEEIYDLSFEEWYNVTHFYDSYYYEFNLYYNSDDYNTKFINIPVPASVFPKTFNMLLEAENIDSEERFKEVEKMVTDEEFMSNTDLLSLSMDVTLLTYDDEGNEVQYVAHSGDFVSWKESKYFNAFADMCSKVKECKDAPSAEGYICVDYNYEKGVGEELDYKSYEDYEYVSDRVYLPLPEDFDYISWGFVPIDSDYNYR